MYFIFFVLSHLSQVSKGLLVWRWQGDGIDPLDAFMEAEIIPEVKAKEAQEVQRKEEERKLLAKQIAVRCNYSVLKHMCHMAVGGASMCCGFQRTANIALMEAKCIARRLKQIH